MSQNKTTKRPPVVVVVVAIVTTPSIRIRRTWSGGGTVRLDALAAKVNAASCVVICERLSSPRVPERVSGGAEVQLVVAVPSHVPAPFYCFMYGFSRHSWARDVLRYGCTSRIHEP